MSYMQQMEELVEWFIRFFNIPCWAVDFKKIALDYLHENPVRCYLAYVEARKILFGKEV